MRARRWEAWCWAGLVGWLAFGWSLTGAAAEGRSAITNAAGMRPLTRTNFVGSFPLRMQVTCLYSDTNWGSIWLGDESGAFWTGVNRAPAWLRAGDRVLVEGVTLEGKPEVDWGRVRCRRSETNAFPAPRLLTDEALALKDGGDIWTEIVGIVRRASYSRRHVRAELIVGRRLCEVTLPMPDRRDLFLEETEVRCRGIVVPADRYAPAGFHLKLFVPDSRFVSLARPNLDRHFEAPLAAAGVPPGGDTAVRVRIRGPLALQEPGRLHLRDTALGSCLVESDQVRRLPEGSEVEAVGLLGRTETGEARLREGLYRAAVAAARPSKAAPPRLEAGDEHSLHRFVEVRAVPLEEAGNGWRAAIEGVVLADLTPQGWDVLFVQDVSGSAYLRSGTNVWNLKLGDRVRVAGVTEAGPYGTNLREVQVERLGSGPPPVPRQASLGHLQLGAEDGRWVEVRAWVRQAYVEDNVLHLETGDGSGRLDVFVGASEVPPGLRDSVVRIRGVVAGRFSEAQELIGVVLFCPSLDQVEVEDPSPAEPFDFPVEPIAGLRRWHPEQIELRRARVVGVVTATGSSGSLFLQDAEQALVVRLWEALEVPPGMRLEAVGVPYWRGPLLELRDARVNAVGSGEVPAAVRLGTALELGPGHAGRRCSVEAPLVAVTRSRNRIVLDLTSETALEAVCPDVPGNASLLALRPGSRLRVTGALECRFEGPGVISDLQLALASAADVEVVRPGPWWGRRHTAWAGGGAAALMMVGLGWVRSLRGQVRRRTVELTHELAEREQAEEALRDSLHEKEALLREIHHRVKNNLQIVSSLLSLQGDQIEHPAAREALADTRSRVHSMALLHEALYRSGDLAILDVRGYTENLISHLSRALPGRDQPVRFSLEIADVRLDLERAVPVGVILNELVTNSLKHAFPDGRPGTITVRMGPAPPDRIRLEVADDGVGMPAAAAGGGAGNPDSLGLLLVSDLARQLRGEYRVVAAPGPGTVSRIDFPEKAPS